MITIVNMALEERDHRLCGTAVLKADTRDELDRVIDFSETIESPSEFDGKFFANISLSAINRVLTRCADCGIDDFCHDEDCELEATADMPKMSKSFRDEGETSSPDKDEHVLDVLVRMKRFAAYIRKQNASDEASGESSIAASMSNAMADLIDSYVNRLERAYTYDIWLMAANKERKFDNG